MMRIGAIMAILMTGFGIAAGIWTADDHFKALAQEEALAVQRPVVRSLDTIEKGLAETYKNQQTLHKRVSDLELEQLKRELRAELQAEGRLP